MYELIKETGVFLLAAHISDKTTQDSFEEAVLVFDTGCAFTLLDVDFMDAIGYEAGRDGIRLSKLDGAVGSSKGFTVTVPIFRCLGQEIADFEMDIDLSTGIIHSIHPISPVI
jgi:hypothetical protein